METEKSLEDRVLITDKPRWGDLRYGIVAIVIMMALSGGVMTAASFAYVRVLQQPTQWTAQDYRSAGYDILPNDAVRLNLGKKWFEIPIDAVYGLQQRGATGQVSEIEVRLMLPDFTEAPAAVPIQPGHDAGVRVRLWHRHTPQDAETLREILLSNSLPAEWTGGLRLHNSMGVTNDRFVPEATDTPLPAEIVKIDCDRIYTEEAENNISAGDTADVAAPRQRCLSTIHHDSLQMELTFDRAHLPDWQRLHRALVAKLTGWRADS